MPNWEIIKRFQENYPTREEKEQAIAKMSDEEFKELLDSSGNGYGKMFYIACRRKSGRMKYKHRTICLEKHNE